MQETCIGSRKRRSRSLTGIVSWFHSGLKRVIQSQKLCQAFADACIRLNVPKYI